MKNPTHEGLLAMRAMGRHTIKRVIELFHAIWQKRHL
jgi:hypothetical protein